jgi:hypothetical protein
MSGHTLLSMRRWGIGVAALAVAAASLAATGPSHPEPALSMKPAKVPKPLLGIVGDLGDSQLVRLDPTSLRPLPGPKVDVLDWGGAWAFSPDRSRIALGTGCQAGVSLGTLQLVDVRRMRSAACFVIGGYGGGSRTIAWPTPNRVLVATHSPLQVVFIDARSRRIIQRTPLEGIWLSGARARDRMVVLTGTRDRPERLVLVDARGGVRSVAVHAPRATDFVVDPSGRRAYLVSGSTVAEVELDSLAVAYHELHEPVSLFRRALAWLVPAAQAKEFHREYGRTLWVGRGLIASVGSEVTYDGGRFSSVPVGLRLIDIRDWTVRMVDDKVSSALLAGDVLLAAGAAEIGLVAYNLNGSKRYELFRGQSVVPLESFRSRAWVGVRRPSGVFRILDVRTGRVVGSGPLPTLLVER